MGESVRQAREVGGVEERSPSPALRPTFSHLSLNHVREISVPQSWHSRSDHMADVLFSVHQAPTRAGCSEDGRDEGVDDVVRIRQRDAALLRVPGSSSPTLVPQEEASTA